MEMGADTSGALIPLWFQGINREVYPQLNQDIVTDICIIGAGISGLTTAYRLVCEGKSVVVIDDGKVASGESGRTTAHLTNILDDRYCKIKKIHGEEAVNLVSQSHTAAIQFIEHTCQNEKIECEFERVNGYLFLDEESSLKDLIDEFELTKQMGLMPQLLQTAPENTFDMKTAILFPNQAQFHPMKYLDHLAKIIVAKGGKLFENSHAKKIEKGNPVKIVTESGNIITANTLVVATNVPVNNQTIIHTKQEAKRTYVISYLIPKNSVKAALYWDTATPYHYVRVHSGDYSYQNQPCDLLIIGGEDHRTGKPPVSYEECFKRVDEWSKTVFPNIIKEVNRWSGQIIEPVDYLAFIGHNPLDNENCFIVTGDSGNGLTHGTIAGILISDLILHRSNEWKEYYRPSRKSIKAWKNFVKTNLLSALTYLNYCTPESINNVDKIQPGEGAVIRKGLLKIAVYRDNHGELHECSAICPHMHSILRWNSCEKTWDCPAHGSRFTGEGTVINGPANASLNNKSK